MKPYTFLRQIEERFSYLFDEYGFFVIHEEHHNRNGYNAVVVLESRGCRIRLLLEREQVLVDVGSLSAPKDWSTPAPDEWFGLTYVTGFLSNGTDQWKYEFPDTALDRSLRIDQQLIKLAGKLRPYCDQILCKFHPAAFEQTQRELVDYQETQVDTWIRQYR
jgi:hypothetical protein